MIRFDLDWIGNHYWRRSVALLGFWSCLVVALGLFATGVFFTSLYVVGETMEHFTDETHPEP